MQRRIENSKPSTAVSARQGPANPTAVKAGALKLNASDRASDEDLMRRARKGDRQAFSIIYERYSMPVLSYLYRMLGTIEDSESTGQEVFLRAFRHSATYRFPQQLSTWLFTIARHSAINQVRRNQKGPIRSIAVLKPEGSAEKHEQIARILDALDDLPGDQKEVIVLGVFQDLSYAQVEIITGTKAVTLQSNFFNGLTRLGRTRDASPAEEKIETHSIAPELTEALRAGPGTPQWRDAVTQMTAGSIQDRENYALLIQTRENLANAKEYRQLRATRAFTQKVIQIINDDMAATARSPMTASLVSYMGAGLVVGIFAFILIWLTQAGGNNPGEDLTGLFINNALVTATLEGPLPSGWRPIGQLTMNPSKGLSPTTEIVNADYLGGGIVTTSGLTPDQPFAVEASFQFQHISDDVVPELFVTDNSNFNPSRGVSPHEFVWLVKGAQQQMTLPNGKLAGSARKVVDGQSILVRIVVGATDAVVTTDGNVFWTGPSEFGTMPRFAGVRLLYRKGGQPGAVTIKQLRVLGKSQ